MLHDIVQLQPIKIPHVRTQHGVHPTGGSRRVFRQFVWLEVGSVKMALSRPTHQRVTRAVDCKDICNRKSATRSVTVLTKKTAITWVTPSGAKARRCRNENRDQNSPTSRCAASARLEEE